MADIFSSIFAVNSRHSLQLNHLLEEPVLKRISYGHGLSRWPEKQTGTCDPLHANRRCRSFSIRREENLFDGENRNGELMPAEKTKSTAHVKAQSMSAACSHIETRAKSAIAAR